MANPRQRRGRALGVIFGVVLADLLSFGILIPQLGLYAVKYRASPLEVGLLGATYSLMQLVAAPLWGRLSDRVGRRPVLLVSISGSLVGYLLFALAPSLPLLFLARAVDGASGGNISTAQAYVADVTSEEERTKGMGMVGAAIGLGFILGPAVGGLLGAWGGNLAIGLGAGALALCNLVAAWHFLPESRPPAPGRGPQVLPSLVPAPRGGAFALPVVGAGLLLFALFTTAFALMEGTFSLLLLSGRPEVGPEALRGGLWGLQERVPAEVLRRVSLLSGLLFAVVGVVSALVQGGLIGRLRQRWGETQLVVAGVALTGVALLWMPEVQREGALALPLALLAVGSSLHNPSLSALVSLHAPEGQRGAVLGTYQAMGALGRVVGPALGGLLFELAGRAAPYRVGAGLLAVGLLLALRLHGRVRRVARAGAT